MFLTKQESIHLHIFLSNFSLFYLFCLFLVYVANSKQKIIAKRVMLLRPMTRCFCLWLCMCVCIKSFANSTDASSNMCQQMGMMEAKAAGFRNDYDNGSDYDDANNDDVDDDEDRMVVFNWYMLYWLCAAVVLLILALGKVYLFFILF